MSCQCGPVGRALREIDHLSRIAFQVKQMFRILPAGIDDVLVASRSQHPPTDIAEQLCFLNAIGMTTT